MEFCTLTSVFSEVHLSKNSNIKHSKVSSSEAIIRVSFQSVYIIWRNYLPFSFKKYVNWWFSSQFKDVLFSGPHPPCWQAPLPVLQFPQRMRSERTWEKWPLRTASIPRKTNCHLLIQIKNWVFFSASCTSDLQSCLFPFNRQYFSIFNKLNLSNGACVKMYISVLVGAQDFSLLDCPQVDEMGQRTHLHGRCQWGVGTGIIEPLSTLWSSLCAHGT